MFTVSQGVVSFKKGYKSSSLSYLQVEKSTEMAMKKREMRIFVFILEGFDRVLQNCNTKVRRAEALIWMHDKNNITKLFDINQLCLFLAYPKFCTMKCDVDPCNCLECKDMCPFFTRLAKSDLELLNHSKRAVKFSKGEVILKKGAYNPYVLLISSGYVKVIVEADFKKRFIMEILEPHKFVPGNLFGDGINKTSTVALTECVICYIPIVIFTELLERNGPFSTDVMKHMNLNGGVRFNRLQSITLKQTRGKLVDVILYIDSMNSKGNVFKLLSRKDLADMANISMENAIRTLRELEEEKAISTNKKDIEILNRDVLLRYSLLG